MLHSDSVQDSALSAQLARSQGGICLCSVARKFRASPPTSSAWVIPSAQPPCCSWWKRGCYANLYRRNLVLLRANETSRTERELKRIWNITNYIPQLADCLYHLITSNLQEGLSLQSSILIARWIAKMQSAIASLFWMLPLLLEPSESSSSHHPKSSLVSFSL